MLKEEKNVIIKLIYKKEDKKNNWYKYRAVVKWS